MYRTQACIDSALIFLTLMHSIPSFSKVLWMGSSCASTNTLLGSSMSTFMESHLVDIQRGWLSGITGLGAFTTCQGGIRVVTTHDKHPPWTPSGFIQKHYTTISAVILALFGSISTTDIQTLLLTKQPFFTAISIPVLPTFFAHLQCDNTRWAHQKFAVWYLHGAFK